VPWSDISGERSSRCADERGIPGCFDPCSLGVSIRVHRKARSAGPTLTNRRTTTSIRASGISQPPRSKRSGRPRLLDSGDLPHGEFILDPRANAPSSPDPTDQRRSIPLAMAAAGWRFSILGDREARRRASPERKSVPAGVSGADRTGNACGTRRNHSDFAGRFASSSQRSMGSLSG